MNPKKHVFGVITTQFLGFMIHEQGIETRDKIKDAITMMVPPIYKMELSMIDKINYVRRFTSNLSGRIESFMQPVKINNNQKFVWDQNNRQHSTTSIPI
jgi:hypothetical protein